MANKIKLGRGTKERIETIKETLDNYEIVYSMDTKELGVKNADGTITYFGVVTELEWANILNKPTFATVAISGDYEDLEGKPDLNLKLDKNFSALPTQTNPLLTDVLVLNRGTTVQKVTLGNLLSQVNNEIFEVVSVLPATGVVNKIYLVPSGDPQTQNAMDEFIWVDNAWEKIGSVSVDLSNYFNKTEINSMLESKVDKNVNITAGTHPKITYDAKGLVTGGAALVANDIPNLNASKINAGEFDAARIPSLAASKITQTASARFVTDTEKTTWNNKVDKVSGKGLSTNDFTNNDKNKLDGIEAGAEKNVGVEFTQLEKSKLATIEQDAEKNTVDSVNGKTGIVVVNKSDVGLPNVDNTADLAKPISTATQTALNLKADKTQLTNYVTTTTFDMQMLEKLAIKPNGTDLLIIGGMINPLYIDDASYKSNHPTVNSQAAMLALDVPAGTVVVRLDTPSKELFLLTQLPASTLANWQVVSSNTVVSVAGKTGAVVLGITDIDGLDNALNLKLDITTFESQLTQLQTDIAGKANDDEVAKLAVSNVFTQPQIVPNAENDDEAVNLGQLNTVVSIWRYN